MHKRNLSVLIILFSALTTTALPQTVDEIIQKHIEALGGAEKIQAIKTLKMTGTSTRGNRFEVKFVRYWKYPNLVRNESEIRGQIMVQAYDGESAWGIIPFRGDGKPQALQGRRAQNFIRQGDFSGPLVHVQEKGLQVEFKGIEEFEGTEVFKLKISGTDGRTFFTYLDTQYYMEIKRVVKKPGPDGNEMEITTLFSDYKPVNGVMIAHALETLRGGFSGRRGRGGRGGGKNVTTIEKIEVNQEIDDGIFKMPGK
ncbi:MAG: hypothetical protein ACE5IR_19600 [bacterium]